MGFGLLLIGYLVANVMSYSFVPKFLGYALMMWGCIKLSDYDTKFRACMMPAVPAGILSVYLYGDHMCKLFKFETALFPQSIVSSVSLIESLLSAGFTVLMLIAIISIAKSTELDKLSFKAARNIVILGLGEVAYIVARCLPIGQVANAIAYGALIVRALHIFLDLLLLFACYRMICKEGDEDMPAKEINIPIIRKMEEVLNKRDKNAYQSAKDFSEKRYEKKKKKKKK